MSILCLALLQVQHALALVADVVLSLPAIVLGALL
jgi:hypothetical protein